MELDELKGSWKQSGEQLKSKTALEQMTMVRNHPKLRRIRLKLIIETTLLISLVIFYSDIFDGADKPTWANMILLTSALLYIFNDINGYLVTKSPIKANSLRPSIDRLARKLTSLSRLSIISSLFFGLSIILFFISTIDFDLEKYLIIGGMVITLMVMTYASYKNWSVRIKHFQKVVEELGE